MNRVIIVSAAVVAVLLSPVAASASTGEICAWKDDPIGYPVPKEVCIPLQCGSICDILEGP